MRDHSNPELIASIEALDETGGTISYGTRIVGVSVLQDKTGCREGEVSIDVRDLEKGKDNLMIRLPLPELMAALASATLNAERI